VKAFWKGLMMDTPDANVTVAVGKDKKPVSFLINLLLYGMPILVIVWILSQYLMPKPAIEGKPAPPFKAALVGGGTFDLSENLGKRPILLDFWAVWCPPCRKALPNVGEMAQQYADKDIAICTVNLSEKETEIQAFLQANDLEVPVAMDNGGAIALQYGVRTIPMLVFIDRAGTVVEAHLGGMSEGELKSRIDKLLAGD
jgi:thiol-disulfide isomerase/thioredoxin